MEPSWSERIALQVQIPLGMGGMGLRSLERIASAAYLGSWAQCVPYVTSLLGFNPVLHSDTSTFS